MKRDATYACDKRWYVLPLEVETVQGVDRRMGGPTGFRRAERSEVRWPGKVGDWQRNGGKDWAADPWAARGKGGNRRAQNSDQPKWPFQREAAASPMSARSALFCAPEWSAQRGCCGGRYTASVALVLVSVVGIVQGAPGQGSETQTTRSHPVYLHHPRPALHNRGGEWLTVAGLKGGCSPGRRGRIIRMWKLSRCPTASSYTVEGNQNNSGQVAPYHAVISAAVRSNAEFTHLSKCFPLTSYDHRFPVFPCEVCSWLTRPGAQEHQSEPANPRCLAQNVFVLNLVAKKENTVSFVESSVYEATGTDCAEPHRGPSVEFPIRALATACMALYSNGNILLKPNLTGTEGINTEQPPSRRPLSLHVPTLPSMRGRDMCSLLSIYVSIADLLARTSRP
ncbi:conserved hypothetical protein [Coccidioides posadasii str. Silveira]|uniref:Uncharacterized protein n=2 Tax=Coccidioides posadasii TaxID=199306 RepID=E9D8B2_COCPS|nr:conserved hypothetical protein [Coccidioides posadasii str. Silveira]KMM70736.1 hypothetical protein CPAG_07048 [Coccidioides posadasii RMSCC 3488]